MEYKIGDVFIFPNGTKGTVASVSKNILGGQELDIDVNGEIKFAYIDEDGNIK